DQPTGDALNTWLVSQVAAKDVKVTLSGLGADEWFGGYNYHRLINLALRVPAHAALGRVAGPLVRLAGKLLPAGVQGHRSWKALLYASGAAGTELAAMHAHARTIFNRAEIAALLQCPESKVDAISLRNELRDSLIENLSQRAPDGWLNQLLLLETETYLANTLLRDNDVTSMVHSLELRVPLVDREIFTLAGRIAPDAKLNMQGGKRILREAFADLLPEWIAKDTAKKTFTLPLMKWMRQPRWKERIMDTLTSREARDRGWLDASEVDRHLKRYYTATLDDKRAWRLSQTVWLMFVLESWARAGK
ncbi:MAG: asparagine synthase-related protein, partial [Roseimicrobium sp.]